MDVTEAIAEVEAIPGVDYAQPNYKYQLVEPLSAVEAAAVSVNDQFYTEGYQTNLSLANVLDAWGLVKTQGNVSIAVIDTGCRLTHYDLRDVVDHAHAWDVSEGRNQPLATSVAEGSVANGGDGNGHGTHVCGILGAQTNDNYGMAGVSYNANVIPICTLDAEGSCDTSDVYNALAKVDELHDSMPNLRVVNMSLGGEGSDNVISNSIALLASEGVLCVCAAGNENSTATCFPCDCSGALSVMALDQNGQHTYYTNYKTGSSIDTTKTVSAMGGGGNGQYDTVLSCYNTDDNIYAFLSGTSMATPLVSGVASLVWTADPLLTPREVMDILTSTATKVNSSSAGYAKKDAASAGSVDAYAAVTKALGSANKSVARPQAPNDLVYNGETQVALRSTAAYTLSGTTSAKNAGTYTARAKPNTARGYTWDDGTTNEVQITWRISKAGLTATYAGGLVQVGDEIPTTVNVTGFVAGETVETAESYVAPTVDMSGVSMTQAGTYSLTPGGGSARNYAFVSYRAGTLVVTDKTLVPIRAATTGLVYTGKSQTGVAAGTGYTVSGGTKTRAGTYTATLRLSDPEHSEWSDGTTADKKVTWSIAKASLKATYAGGTMYMGGTLPATVTVTGFVNGETASTAKSYTAPSVKATSTQLATPGSYTLRPTGGYATDYKFTYVYGTLKVYGKMAVPSVTNRTYTGSAQTGVAAGLGYGRTGTYQAVNAGTYTAKVTPYTYYVWNDGTHGAKTLTWTIGKASLAGASMSSVGAQTYTGYALMPYVSVSWGGRVLASGTDYTLSYTNNVAAGTATVTAVGKGNFQGRVSKTFRINEAPATVSYRTHVQRVGWQRYVSNGAMSGTSGKSYRLEGINVMLGSRPYSGGIQYRTHVQRIGWQSWRRDNAMAGTSGKSYRLEAIEIKLYGEMANHYDVYYRVHCQKFGWMGWAKNGGRSGSAGYGRRLEGIQIVIVPKGSSAPGTYYAGIQQNVGSPFAQR
jgi:subtilisin family serine protease